MTTRDFVLFKRYRRKSWPDYYPAEWICALTKEYEMAYKSKSSNAINPFVFTFEDLKADDWEEVDVKSLRKNRKNYRESGRNINEKENA